MKLRTIVLLLIFSGAFFTTALPSNAQSGIIITLSPPIVDDFPEITFFVEISDANGRRIPNIPSSSFGVIEDESPIRGVQVEEKVVGAQQVFVVNTNLGMRIRDTLGNSRFDIVTEALIDWWSRPDASVLEMDVLSLQTTDGVLVSHSTSTAELATVLDNHAPAFEDVDSEYDLLFSALDLVSDSERRAGRPSYLFFITSLPRAPRELPITNIISRAQGSGTRIYTVLIGSQEAFESVEAEFLAQIADETGGRLLFFDKVSGLDELADLVAAQRTQYQLTYSSRAVDTGPHQVQVSLSGRGLELLSEPETFVVDIQPPEVSFIQPPRSIHRTFPDTSDSPESLTPQFIEIPVVISFPDSHEREVQQSRLYVDGEIVDQRDDPPYDALSWDLRSAREDADHTIRVSVIDSLGLEGSSSSFPVTLTVQKSTSNLVTLRPALGSLITAMGVLILGVIAAAVLISFGRRRMDTSKPRDETTIRRRTLRRAGMRESQEKAPIEARLVQVGQDSDGEEAIPLTGVDIIVGSDPSLAAVPIEDPSIDGMHARLIRQVDGGYLIRDQDSGAGTWVNFEPIPIEGKRLEHGDLIQFGATTFRFQLTDPPPARMIRTKSIQEDDDDATIAPEVGS